MIRIGISCGEGYSSGYLAKHLSKCVEQEGLQDRAVFICIPFFELLERQDEVDIAMLMPVVEWKAQKSEHLYHIPLYIIPYKVAIKPTAEDYIEDAEDILSIANGASGLITFPDEKVPAHVSRLVSHRRAQKRAARKKHFLFQKLPLY